MIWLGSFSPTLRVVSFMISVHEGTAKLLPVFYFVFLLFTFLHLPFYFLPFPLRYFTLPSHFHVGCHSKLPISCRRNRQESCSTLLLLTQFPSNPRFCYVIDQWDELISDLWNCFSQLLFTESPSTSSSSGSKAISRGTKASNKPSSFSFPKPSQDALELPGDCAPDLSWQYLNQSAPVHGTEIRKRRTKTIC